MGCSYQTLFCSEHGYVIRCNGCGNFHVAFGTAVITLGEEDYRQFDGLINETYMCNVLDAKDGRKRHVLNASQYTALALTDYELGILHDMMLQASALLETEKILLAVQ
jgi:hypothetical protein